MWTRLNRFVVNIVQQTRVNRILTPLPVSCNRGVIGKSLGGVGDPGDVIVLSVVNIRVLCRPLPVSGSYNRITR